MLLHIVSTNFISIIISVICFNRFIAGLDIYQDRNEWRRDLFYEDVHSHDCDFPIIDYEDLSRQNIPFVPNEQQPYIIRNAVHDWVRSFCNQDLYYCAILRSLCKILCN